MGTLRNPCKQSQNVLQTSWTSVLTSPSGDLVTDTVIAPKRPPITKLTLEDVSTNAHSFGRSETMGEVVGDFFGQGAVT